MALSIVNDLTEAYGHQAVVAERDGEYFIVSRLENAPYTRLPETLVFRCPDSTGYGVSHDPVGGGIEMSFEDALDHLDTEGPDDGFDYFADPRATNQQVAALKMLLGDFG